MMGIFNFFFCAFVGILLGYLWIEVRAMKAKIKTLAMKAWLDTLENDTEFGLNPDEVKIIKNKRTVN